MIKLQERISLPHSGTNESEVEECQPLISLEISIHFSEAFGTCISVIIKYFDHFARLSNRFLTVLLFLVLALIILVLVLVLIVNLQY